MAQSWPQEGSSDDGCRLRRRQRRPLQTITAIRRYGSKWQLSPRPRRSGSAAAAEVLEKLTVGEWKASEGGSTTDNGR